jgi:hypothetical protein
MRHLIFFAFLLAPALLLFAAASKTGQRWLLLVPVLGWPLLLIALEMGSHAWPTIAVLGALIGSGGVWLGLLVHRSRTEAST